MTPGDNWIKLLRAYGPVPDGTSQEAENVEALAQRCGIPKLAFNHPSLQQIEDCVSEDGDLLSLVLTGIAGDGKSSLCLSLIEKLQLKTKSFVRDEEGGKLTLDINGVEKTLTFIFDVTAWRRRGADKKIKAENVELLEKFANHAQQGGNDGFILGVNDGQMHEIFRALPATCSQSLKTLGKNLLHMHAEGMQRFEESPWVRMINLSDIQSDTLMELCLDGILNRPEWECLETEKNTNPLFGPNSPIPTNYRLLKTPEVQHRLLTVARIADANSYHLTIRALLILIVNALLGHPKATSGLLKPGAEATKVITEGARSKSALHLNLFGYNLKEENRRERMIFSFLAMLHAGDETTTDVDELIVFGKRDETLSEEYNRLVANDPENQRNPEFEDMVARYIRGEMDTPEEAKKFLDALAHERRRIFLHATEAQVKAHKLWSTTVFHHAGEFVDEFLDPIRANRPVQRLHVRHLAIGLNRVWTGLLLEDGNSIYISTGLDMSTSPVSDLLLKEIEIHAEPTEFDVVGIKGLPTIRLRQPNGRKHEFKLTMLRFEFLMRVANGAMPTSFSREAYEDFLSLKQCAVRDLEIKQNPNFLQRIDVREGGQIHKELIYLT
jgi:hypothetical protein